MYDQKAFRIVMIGTLFVTLALYHITNILMPDYWTTSNDVFSLLKLSQLGLITLFALTTAYSSSFAQFVFKRLHRSDYIGGCYVGTSGDVGNQTVTGSEVFTITQSLFDISISGKTYSIEKSCDWASWNGRAFINKSIR